MAGLLLRPVAWLVGVHLPSGSPLSMSAACRTSAYDRAGPDCHDRTDIGTDVTLPIDIDGRLYDDDGMTTTTHARRPAGQR
jgi:hypothetical protein